MTTCTACSKLTVKMRHRITIQADNPGTDAAGGSTNPWASPTDIVSLKAAIVPVSGRELLRGMQTENPVSHKITTRYKSGVTASHRIKFGTRFFNIRAVINVEEANRFYEILADEFVAGATN